MHDAPEPVGHVLHAALPVVVLYFPATQAVHGPPSGPVNPALQDAETQALTAELPPGEVVPAGHETHAPAVAEYVPAGQLAHPDVALTQLFSCADAWAKSAFDRCVFQI